MTVDATTAARLAPRTVTMADIAPDGGRILVRDNADTEAPQLWLLGTDGARRRLTDHLDKVDLGSFAPDGRHVVYGVDDGGDECRQLHLIDLETGTSRALTAAPHAMHEFGGFRPDGAAVAFASNAENGVDFDIYVQALDGSAARRVMRGQGLRTVKAWSPDGSRVAVVATASTFAHELHLLDVATGAIRPLLATPTGARFEKVAFLEDGDLLLLTDLGREHLGVARLGARDGRLRWIVATDADIETMALDKAKARVAVVVNHAGYATLEVHDLAGAAAPLPLPSDGVVGDLVWQPDGAALLGTVATSTRPPRPWRFDLAGGEAAPLTGFAVEPDGVEPTLVHVASFDGRRIPGFLYTPTAPTPAGGRPAVVIVHGGPESQWRPNFHGYVQAFVARGWTVLAPNVRGSTGHGRHYAALDDRERRLEAVEDLAYIGRWLAAQSDVDATRIAVMGQSYGGFMTLATLLRHPELWCAGVEFYGITDFTTLLRDTAAYRRNHRAAEYGEPARDAALFEGISPLRRIGELRAPLFVAHGLSDPRVAPFESQQLVDALEVRGHPVAYVTVPHEGHGFVKRSNRLEVFGRVLDFLDERL